VTVLFLVVFIDLVGFGIVIPLLPFFGEHFQATPAQVGLLMATYSAAQFLTAPLWGRLSDRIGRRPVLLASLAGIAVAYVFLAFSDRLWMLFAARAAAGAMAGNIGVAFAYVADVTRPEQRARGMGLIGAAFGLGFIFGPAIGGVMAGNDPLTADYRSPALAAAGLSALAWLLAVLRLPESLPAEARAAHLSMPPRRRRDELRAALSAPPVGLFIALSFLANFVFAGMESTFALWSRRQFGWGPEQNGYLFAGVGLLTAAMQGGAVGRLARRFGEKRLVVAGAGLLAVGMAGIPASTTVPALAAAMVVVAVGFGLMSPALNSLISLSIGSEVQGGVFGVARSATTLARVGGPIVAGALFGILGRHWPFFAGASVMVLVMAAAARAPAAGSATEVGSLRPARGLAISARSSAESSDEEEHPPRLS
jgi:DHA1 family tetracycline resistance protein-like MFS transporter